MAVLPLREEDGAQTLCKVVKKELVVTTVRIKTCGVVKSLHFPNDIFNVWDRVGKTLDVCIELAEVSKKSGTTILLFLEEEWCAPYRFRAMTKDIKFTQLLDLVVGD
eukprot:8754994-Ditylum_brightwellii.AAC.1